MEKKKTILLDEFEKLQELLKEDAKESKKHAPIKEGVISAAPQRQTRVIEEPWAAAELAQQAADPAHQWSNFIATRIRGRDDGKRSEKKKKKTTLRHIAGKTWEDGTLINWPENDYRIFVGDLGKDCNDGMLNEAFSKFPGFCVARVVGDKETGRCRGYGFVSFLDPQGYIQAMREMQGKYVGNRPVKLRKSNWQDRAAIGGKYRNKPY